MSEPHPPENQRLPAGLRAVAAPPATTLMLAALLVLAVLYTLYFARAVLLPIVLAVLLALILMPAVRALKRLLVPRGLGAALVVAVLAGILGALGTLVYEPATLWMEKAPYTLAAVERKLRGIRKSVEDMAKVAEKVEQLASSPANAKKPAPPPPAPAPRLLQRTFSTTMTFLATTGTTLVLLYFLLATSDLLVQRTAELFPARAGRSALPEILHALESRMARYFGTVTLINAGLGIATGFAMHWLGLPNAVLWGAMAFAFNYFPYLGAAASLVVLTFVSALTFEELRQVLLPPAVFFGLTVLEGQFLTPLILGRHLILSPVVILVSMLFWAWLWGVVGALLAVPILVAFKTCCEHIAYLKPLGDWLAGRGAPRSPIELATSP
jgi:predicted PurR-regulated permease PerM